MVNTDKFIKKITDFLHKEYSKNVAEISIFKNKDGSYELFNRYIIAERNNKYTVFKKTSYMIKEFSVLKNAVAWCIFEQRNKIRESNRIEDLDRSIDSINALIELHLKLIKKTKNIENKLVYVAKLTDEEAKRQTLMRELSNFVLESKYWQEQEFNKKSKFTYF